MKIFGFAGRSGSCKTTLIAPLITRFVKRGVRVSMSKHAHRSFDGEQPGKDSYRHRQAGCSEVMVVSDRRWVMMHELRGEPEPSLEDQIERISPCDLLLVEGHKHHPLPKLEIWRKENGKSLLYPEDAYIVAIAADAPLETKLPRFDLNDHKSIEDFILSYNGFR